MSQTTDTLAAYLADTHDAKGVVALIRERWPGSIASYVSQTKKQWLTLNVINEGYAAQYSAALTTVDSAVARAKGTEKELLRSTRAKLIEFNALNLANKPAVQRRLKAAQHSGHAM
eukprot:3196-Heterococcus_DN1.PRE.1